MERLKCPSCGSLMEKVKEPDVAIDKCTKCGGKFLDQNELNALAVGMAGNIEYCSIDCSTDERDYADTFPERKCPKCMDQAMDKTALLCYTDAILDHCSKCGGFFIDAGEMKQVNATLEKLTERKSAEEYRGSREGYLVRLDKLNDVHMVSRDPMGITTVPQNVFYLRLAVYFKQPLNLGLRMYSEKWTHKFTKAIGLFRKQDIQVDDSALDSDFIIQGNDVTKIKKLLSSVEVRTELSGIRKLKKKMASDQASIEVLDNRVLCTEGPFSGAVGYDVDQDPNRVVDKLLEFAKAVEKAK